MSARMNACSDDVDVTRRIRTTDPAHVAAEVSRIYRAAYSRAPGAALLRAFDDAARMYRGEYPGYAPRETGCRDLRHAMEVALATARLIDGYGRWRGRGPAIGGQLFQLGVICALFHDVGYLRRTRERTPRGSAWYAQRRVARGARFLRGYLATIGMGDLALAAGPILQFTGCERPVASIRIAAPVRALVGRLVGSADLMVLMSERCGRGRCGGRLFPELAAGEGAGRAAGVFRTLLRRLEVDLGGAHEYARAHFGGRDPYADAMLRNARRLERVAAAPRNVDADQSGVQPRA